MLYHYNMFSTYTEVMNMHELGMEYIPLWIEHFSTVYVHVRSSVVIDSVTMLESGMDTKQKDIQAQKGRDKTTFSTFNPVGFVAQCENEIVNYFSWWKNVKVEMEVINFIPNCIINLFHVF